MRFGSSVVERDVGHLLFAEQHVVGAALDLGLRVPDAARGVALRVHVDEEHALLGDGEARREVHGGGRLADAAFLVRDREHDAHGRARCTPRATSVSIGDVSIARGLGVHRGSGFARQKKSAPTGATVGAGGERVTDGQSLARAPSGATLGATSSPVGGGYGEAGVLEESVCRSCSD
jgi:hypothetical protein